LSNSSQFKGLELNKLSGEGEPTYGYF